MSNYQQNQFKALEDGKQCPKESCLVYLLKISMSKAPIRFFCLLSNHNNKNFKACIKTKVSSF